MTVRPPVRADLTARSGHDWSGISDSEALDGIEYFVFPNFVPWDDILLGLGTLMLARWKDRGNVGSVDTRDAAGR